MKFLDAQKKEGKEPKKSVIPEENKMLGGSRRDQQKLDPKNPESLISGSKGSRATTGQADVSGLARELNVDLADVKGTGPNGTITEKDVRLAHRTAADK